MCIASTATTATTATTALIDASLKYVLIFVLRGVQTALKYNNCRHFRIPNELFECVWLFFGIGA